MTKKPKPAPPVEVAIRQAHGWVAAAIAQGERLLGLIKAQGAVGSTEAWSAEQWAAFNKLHGIAWDHLTEEFEAYYFLCALRQVDRWVQHAESADRSLTKAFGAFKTAVPHLKDIRDMREHEDAYLAGAGDARATLAREGLVSGVRPRVSMVLTWRTTAIARASSRSL